MSSKLAEKAPESSTADKPYTFNVLVTGFGPFGQYDRNPSWLAAEPLHNTILHTTPSTKPIIVDDQVVMSEEGNPIHIVALQIPYTYSDVLDIVPNLHTKPPILPSSVSQFFPPPPEHGYDFIFHIGVAGRGALRMERVGHKLGYHMKDASGKLASVVRSSPKDFSRRGGADTNAENIERERLGIEPIETGGDSVARPTRGFGQAYENFPDEINTDIDVTKLVADLKLSGIEQIYSSMDAGHYISDFVFYCSLAEAKRTDKPYEKRRNTQVLFLHCPPVNQPLSTEEVTEAIKRIIVWVCGEIQLTDDAAEVVQAPGVVGA